MRTTQTNSKDAEYLIDVIQELSLARSLDDVIEVTRHAARELTGADGAAFVLRDQDRCYYVDEDAIGPLWKGKKFPMTSCISGWSMMNRQSVAIEDVFQDPRIPVDAYRPTFVKSLLVVPIREDKPIGAIGNYWARHHRATHEQTKLLRALASSTSIALENVKLITDLKEANEFLGDSLQARDEFFSIASHELRTPISAIKLQLQMSDRKLKKIYGAYGGNESPLGVSLEQADRLGLLIEQLLDVSRIRLGKLELEFSHFDLSELVLSFFEHHKVDLEHAGCRLRMNLQRDLWGTWDKLKIEQILGHLTSNVVRHAPGSLLQISLRSLEREEILLTIEDDGPGVSHEIQGSIFKRFERSHAPRKLGGLGLGLFLVRSLIEAHHGSIRLESELGVGSKFEIILPRKIT